MTTRNNREMQFSRRTLAVAIGMALASGSVHAATFQVTSAADNGAGSLREAMQLAEVNGEADIIDLSGIAGQTITLEDDLPRLNEDLTLQGSDVTIDGAQQHSCLRMDSADLAVNDMTITRCTGSIEYSYSGGGYSQHYSYGGGILLINGNLSVDNSTITGNQPRPSTGTDDHYLEGGGISVMNGQGVTITNSVIDGNTADYGAGGLSANVYQDIQVSDTVISGNSTVYGIGGVLLSSDAGNVGLSSVTISNNAPLNAADESGGGGYIEAYNGSVDIESSEIRDNVSNRGASGLSIYAIQGSRIVDSTISGNSTTDGAGGLFVVGSLTLEDSRITGNQTTDSGFPDSAGGLTSFAANQGPIRERQENATRGEPSPKYGEVSITRSVISGNSSLGAGGGVAFINLYGSVAIEDSEISDNTAQAGAGVIAQSEGTEFSMSGSTISGNATIDDGTGGGLSVLDKYAGTVALSQSTISGNSAAAGAGAYIAIRAGGRLAVRGEPYPAPVNLDGVTMTGNTANLGPGGGLSVVFDYPARAEILGSIIAGNTSGEGSADFSASAFGSGEPPPPETRSSMLDRLAEAFPRLDLSQWTTRGQLPPPPAPGPENTTFLVDFSIVGEAPTDGSTFTPDTVTGDLLGENPELGPLADNGGATLTHLPDASSPALNIVTAAGGCGTTFAVDQRGEPRPEEAGSQCDAGSVERGTEPLIDVNPDIAFGTVEVGDSVGTQAVTLTNSGGTDLEVSAFNGLSAPFTLDFSDCGAGLPFTVPGGQSCTLQAGFTPTGAGVFAQTISVASNSGAGGDNSFELSGTVVAPGISAAPLAFGGVAVGQTVPGTVTIENTGQGTLDIAGLALSNDGGGVFSLGADSCGAPIAAGGSCEVDIDFSPSSASAFNGSLAVESNATTEALEVAISGEGLVGNLVVAPAGGLDFGDVPVGQSGQADLTLSNDGNAPIEVTGWPDPVDPFSIVGGSCPTPPFTLAPGESCTLTFSFSPSAPGDYDAGLDFGVDDGSGSSAVPVGVAGRGTQLAAVSIPTLNHIGLIIGGGLLALMGLLGLRRRQDGGSA